MIASRPIFHYALVELEALTAHAIQAGRGDSTHDVLLMRDPNGLPALPGSSIAGVLRSLYSKAYPAEQGQMSANDLFGFADASSGQPSWIQFGAGLIHNSKNEAQEGLIAKPEADPLLAFLMNAKPLVRPRVRLTERGVPSEMAKFDITLIPAGARYSTLISYWSDGSNAAERAFSQLLSLLTSPEFRLGHSTRAGQGAFKVNRVLFKRWDLKQSEDVKSYQAYSRSRNNHAGLTDVKTSDGHQMNLSIAELQLSAEAGWRIGGGEQAFSKPNAKGKVPDLLPQAEPVIRWHQNQGNLSKRYAILPASAVKGAISHRFVYHYRRLSKDFVIPGQTQTLDNNLQNPGVQEVFGFVANDRSDRGQVGRLIIDDVYFENTRVARQLHNKIDRFTGGVITGALFEEELLWQTPFTLKLTILDSAMLTPLSQHALNATLDDLANGLLPLGAGGSRGNGIFIGNQPVRWLLNPLAQNKEILA